jgi:hypothetical protein
MKELNLLVENYFTPALDATDILRLVEQVMNEEQRISDKAHYAADEGLEIALATLKDFYKDSKDAPIYHKGNSSGLTTQFSNTGDDNSRNAAIRAVKKALFKSGIEMTLDIRYRKGSEVDSFIGGSWEATTPEGTTVKHSIVLKKGSATGGNTATQFEGNIIVGLYKALGKEKVADAMAISLAETGDIIVDATPEDKVWQNLADSIGVALRGNGIKEGDVITSTSGGKVTASLTQVYLNHGVSSKEAKADIAINDVGVSVKKAGGAQCAGAQGPELAAIFDVVMKSLDEGNELGADIDLFLEQLQRTLGAKTKAHVVERSEEIAEGAYLGAVEPDVKTGKVKMKPNSGRWGSKGDDRSTYGDMASDYTADKLAAAEEDAEDAKAARKKASKADKENAKDKEKKANKLVSKYNKAVKNPQHGMQNVLNWFLFGQGDALDDKQLEFLDDTLGNLDIEGAPSFVKMRESLSGILDSPNFRVGLIKEAVTGEGKFTEEEPKARRMLKWNENSPEESSLRYLDAPWFESHAKTSIMKIRDRGRDYQGDSRGGSWRCDDNELYENFAPHFTELEIEGINKHAAMIYENMIGDDMLTEGIIGDMMASAVGAARNAVRFVIDTAKQVFKYISNALAELSAWLKKLLDRGFSYLLSAFGINVEEYSFEINI